LRFDFCPIFVWYNNGKRLYPTPATLEFTGIFGFSLIIPYGDLLRLTWDDVYDFELKQVKSSFTIIENNMSKVHMSSFLYLILVDFYNNAIDVHNAENKQHPLFASTYFNWI